MTSRRRTPDAEFSDAFDELVDHRAMGAYDGDRLAVRCGCASAGHWTVYASLPCAAHYPALLAIKRSATGSLMEVSRFSIEPDISNTSYRTTLYGSLVRASVDGG